MHNLLFRITICLGLLAGILSANAEPPKVNAIIANLDKTSPVFASAKTKLASVRSEFTSSRAFPNPSLFISQDKLKGGGLTSTESVIGAKQELGFLWSLPSKTAAASKLYQAEIKNYEETRRLVEKEVLTKIYGVDAQKRLISVLDSVIEQGKKIALMVENRERLGGISSWEANRVQSELIELQSRRSELNKEYSESISTLIQLTGLEASVLHSVAPAELQSFEFLNEEEGYQYARTHRPLLAQARLIHESARKSVSVAKWEMLPDFSIGVGQKKVDDDFKGLTWEAEIEIPLFNQNRSQLNVKRATLNETEIALKATENAVKEEISTAFQQWINSEAFLTNKVSEMSLQAGQNVDRAAKLFVAGKYSTLEFVDGLRTSFEAFEAQLNLMKSRNEANLEIRRTTGLPILE